jgi:hypothetical protein
MVADTEAHDLASAASISPDEPVRRERATLSSLNQLDSKAQLARVLEARRGPPEGISFYTRTLSDLYLVDGVR